MSNREALKKALFTAGEQLVIIVIVVIIGSLIYYAAFYKKPSPTSTVQIDPLVEERNRVNKLKYALTECDKVGGVQSVTMNATSIAVTCENGFFKVTELK